MIVVVQVGAVNICVALVEALKRDQNRMKLSLPPKNGAFLSFTSPLLMLMYFFSGFFNLTPFWTKLRGSGAVFS